MIRLRMIFTSQILVVLLVTAVLPATLLPVVPLPAAGSSAADLLDPASDFGVRQGNPSDRTNIAPLPGSPAMAALPDSPNPATTDTYLPLVQRTRIQVPFGIEPIWLADTNLSLAQAANPYWMRYTAFPWNQIEPELTNPRTYLWSRVDNTGLALASSKNFRIVATIKSTPTWAQKNAGKTCGPIDQEYIDEFASFLEAVVARYSIAPYNIKYWELGNEPDVEVNGVPPDWGYGCWGQWGDPYFGGGYYAEMLKVAYPAIKRADPNAKVLIGGLLMDCDPTNPPVGKDCAATKFFEGILNNQGGNYFDIVSFHIYPGYSQGKVIDETHGNWLARGGIFAGKISYLKEIMAKYGVSKPLMLTEIALGCAEYYTECTPPSSIFFEAQADYLVKVFIRSWAAGLEGAIWYSLDDTGWRYVALNASSGPRPAYYAFKFMATELISAKLNAPITSYTGVQGYEFIVQNQRVWVLWSADDLSHTITLPANVIRVLDRNGNPITPQNGQVAVKSPIYIEKYP